MQCTHTNQSQVSPIKTPSVLITKDKIGDHHTHEHDESVSHVGLQAHFETWLQTHHATKQEVVRYQAYLQSRLGNYLPPMSQLLTTARSWQACGHEPYQLPPEHLLGSGLYQHCTCIKISKAGAYCQQIPKFAQFIAILNSTNVLVVQL